jgi:hypothetical protein
VGAEAEDEGGGDVESGEREGELKDALHGALGWAWGGGCGWACGLGLLRHAFSVERRGKSSWNC